MIESYLDYLIKDFKDCITLNAGGSLFHCTGPLYLNDCWVSLILQNLGNILPFDRDLTVLQFQWLQNKMQSHPNELLENCRNGTLRGDGRAEKE